MYVLVVWMQERQEKKNKNKARNSGQEWSQAGGNSDPNQPWGKTYTQQFTQLLMIMARSEGEESTDGHESGPFWRSLSFQQLLRCWGH